MKPIEKVSTIDMVVSNLKELITSQTLKIGDKLPTEKDLCKQLNVSRSTVREAFRVLQAMGYLDIKQGKGAFIIKTKEDDDKSVVNWFVEHEIQVTDLMEVRMAIEPLAIRLAIQRASEEEIKSIEEIHNNFEKSVHDSNSLGLATYDEAFHNEIIKATHNQLLISINEKISNAVIEYRTKAFAVKENAINALEPHKRILNALKTRNINDGVREMINHLNISMKDISDVIKKRD